MAQLPTVGFYLLRSSVDIKNKKAYTHIFMHVCNNNNNSTITAGTSAALTTLTVCTRAYVHMSCGRVLNAKRKKSSVLYARTSGYVHRRTRARVVVRRVYSIFFIVSSDVRVNNAITRCTPRVPHCHYVHPPVRASSSRRVRVRRVK